MALTDRIVAGGAWLKLVADGVQVALVTNVNSDIDHGLQPINVIGVRGPVAWDQLGYTCSITIGAFVAHDDAARQFPDGGSRTVGDFLPLKEDTERSTQQFVVDVLQCENIKTGKIIHQWRRVSLASEGNQFQPNSFLALNVRLMALEQTIKNGRRPGRVSTPSGSLA